MRHAGAQPGRRTAKRTPPGQPNACGASIAPAAATTRSADRASRPGGARAPARLRLQGLAGHRGRRGGPCSRIGQVGGLAGGRGQPGGAPGQVVQVPRARVQRGRVGHRVAVAALRLARRRPTRHREPCGCVHGILLSALAPQQRRPGCPADQEAGLMAVPDCRRHSAAACSQAPCAAVHCTAGSWGLARPHTCAGSCSRRHAPSARHWVPMGPHFARAVPTQAMTGAQRTRGAPVELLRGDDEPRGVHVVVRQRHAGRRQRRGRGREQIRAGATRGVHERHRPRHGHQLRAAPECPVRLVAAHLCAVQG